MKSSWRAAGTLLITPLILTACSPNPSTGEKADSQAPTSSQSASASTPPSLQHESAPPVSGVELTGDIEGDLLATGFKPDNMASSLEYLEEEACGTPLDLDASFSTYKMTVRTLTLNDTAGPDPLRVITHYKCPERLETLEEVIEETERDFG